MPHYGHDRLTCFTARSGEARRTVADSGHVITRRVVKALTDVRTVDSVMAWRTSVLAERSYPARKTGTLPGDEVAVSVVLTLACLITVETELARLTLCQPITSRHHLSPPLIKLPSLPLSHLTPVCMKHSRTRISLWGINLTKFQIWYQ